MKIKHVMTKDPTCCLPSDTAQRAASIMRDEHAGVVPVIDNEQGRKIVGVVTDRDLCMNVVAEGRDPQTTYVQDCMTATVVSCFSQDSVDKATELMRENLSLLKTCPRPLICILRTDSLFGRHGQMAWDPLWGTAKQCSHTPRVGAGESRATAATRGVEGASATAEADTDRPDLLGSAVEAVEELAAFAAGGAAGDRGRLAPPGIQTVLGVEEPRPMGSARDWERTAGSYSADEPRQSSVGCPKDPWRAVEAGPDGLAGDGFEIYGPVSAAAVASVASIFSEPRPGSGGLGFLHGADGDLSSAVCARRAQPRPAAAGAFQCDGTSDGRMGGAATPRGVRPGGGGAAVSDPRPRPGLWRTIFASGQDVGHPGGGYCASLTVAERVCREGDWLHSTGMP